MSFYIDLSELVKNPITTGIQRIEGELCRYMPSRTVVPVRFHAGAYVALPPALINTIARYFRDPGEQGMVELRRLGAVENGVTIHIAKDDVVLVPEVIIEPERLNYFDGMSDEELGRYRFIVYDLLPLTHPEYFWSHWHLEICRYYRIIRKASDCGFISDVTREIYYHRLRRSTAYGGVVLPLGSDSLGPRADRPASERPLSFTVVGTIEPRKNHELILEAFGPLLRHVPGLKLTFIGKMGWVESKFAEKLRTIAQDENSAFHLYCECSDGAIRRLVEQSRATIYVSTAEGYGLPPVESLWAGTPVIVSSTIPSLRGLGSAGIHCVEPLSVVNLRRAVLAFMDDRYAARKIEETTHQNLPTWQNFAEQVLRWCGQANGLASASSTPKEDYADAVW